MRSKLFIAVLCLTLPFMACVKNIAGGSTETTNPAVSAMLYNPGGSPAAHAKVRFYPINYNPRTGGLAKTLAAVVDSTTTDASGNYAAKLDTGTYNVLAAGDSGVVYQDSITVVKDSTVHPPADTLKAPGSIRGVIRLQPGDDARTVFIIFMGTNVLNMPEDAMGNFSVANMAEGTYRVRFLTTLDAYVPKDTVLSASAGKTDSVPHDIVLQYTGIPVPSGLMISYDTLKQIVTLTWNKPTTGRKIAGYNIYRERADSTSFAILKSGATDTIYQDSTGIQDQTYKYRVAVVDTQGTEGVKSMIDSVTIQPAFFIADTIFKVQSPAWVYAVEIDAQGNYVVVNGTAYQPTPASIQRYSPSGTLINSWSIPGGVEESYPYNCLAVGDSNTIFVVTKNNIVIRYDTAGTILGQFQYPGTAEGFGLFGDTLYIGDRIAHVVRAYNSAGDALFAWGSQGSGSGQFGSIGAITTNSENGYVFIEDGQDTINRLQIFDRNGNFKSSFNFQSEGKGLLEGGVLDVRNDTILVYNSALIGAFTINGSIAFKYGISNPNIPTLKAMFYKLTNDIILINWTGEVIRISRK